MFKSPIRGIQERITKVEQHFQDHKNEYLAGVVCFTSGILLARKSVNVTTNVVVVNANPESDTKDLFEKHYPLSASRVRALAK